MVSNFTNPTARRTMSEPACYRWWLTTHESQARRSDPNHKKWEITVTGSSVLKMIEYRVDGGCQGHIFESRKMTSLLNSSGKKSKYCSGSVTFTDPPLRIKKSRTWKRLQETWNKLSRIAIQTGENCYFLDRNPEVPVVGNCSHTRLWKRDSLALGWSYQRTWPESTSFDELDRATIMAMAMVVIVY